MPDKKALPNTELFENVIDLVDDLVDEKCILLVGPEVTMIDGKSLRRYVNQILVERNQRDIIYFYQNDDLFLFRNRGAKIKVARQIKRIYKQLEYSEETYKKILETPFPLIISLNADTFLSDTAKRYGIPHQCGYFRLNTDMVEREQEKMKQPTAACPLIYNLLGCLREDESLVLDYEDLFRLLKEALGPNGIPPKMRTILERARSFFFIGFDFEKWYTQLLLQLLTYEEPGRPKFAINTRIADSEARNFLINQFQLNFLDSDQRFFDNLLKTLREKGLARTLRTPVNIDGMAAEQIRKLVADDKVPEALNYLTRLSIGSSYQDTVALLAARHKKWTRENLDGTQYTAEEEVEIKRIRKNILELAQEIP